MTELLTFCLRKTSNYAQYLWHDITQPTLHSYFYLLIVVSLFFFILEQVKPWRVSQPRIRKDFGLDAFYMFFNFFLFSLLGFEALSSLAKIGFLSATHTLGLRTQSFLPIQNWPVVLQLLLMFVLRDFIGYWVHRLLHRFEILWRFHKVHHSVEQMGFAAHLRFHWAETIVYRLVEFLPLSWFGFGIDDFFLVHAIALTLGHFSHANFSLPLGPFRFVINSPDFHMWHHAKSVPAKHGINFALSLSSWDYLFGTAKQPGPGRDVTLGFDDVEHYPDGFASQMLEPFRLSTSRTD